MTDRWPHQEKWLDELGPMSAAVREIVAEAVLDGDWFLDSCGPYSLTLRRSDLSAGWPAPYDEIVINRTSGRFTGARRYRCEPTGNSRRLDDLRTWIGGEA